MEHTSRSFALEAGAGLADDDLPGYAQMLAAYHRARDTELRAIIAALPLTSTSRVLDLACGDGYYSMVFAERARAVVAADLSPAYLELAQANAAGSPFAQRIHFEQADATALPFDDASFDLAWCAQSFYSLPNPLAALRELARVTKPGGHIAILENDSLHHILLPWPAELELAVRQAQLAALAERQQAQGTDKFYIGRNLCSVFRQCGIAACEVRTFPVERHAPLSADEERFLQMYFAELRDLIWPHLDAAARTAFAMLFNADSHLYMLRQPDLHFTHLESLAVGRR